MFNSWVKKNEFQWQCVFLDLSKAFESKSRNITRIISYNRCKRNRIILIQKLFNMPISPSENQWSNKRYERNGVRWATGNNCRPHFIFNIYLNDLYKIHSWERISYVDDIAIYYEHNTWEILKQTMQIDLKNIKKWFNIKMITINLKNTFMTNMFKQKATTRFQYIVCQ